MAFEQSRYASLFRAEAGERLRAMRRLLSECEKNNGLGDVLTSIRREAHTIGGSATMVGEARIAAMARELESALEGALGQKAAVGRPLFDRIAGWITSMERLLEETACGQERAEASGDAQGGDGA